MMLCEEHRRLREPPRSTPGALARAPSGGRGSPYSSSGGCEVCGFDDRFSSNKAFECDPCPPGSFTSDGTNTTRTSCALCPAGRYSNATGATNCSGTCLVGYTTLSTGSTHPSSCVRIGSCDFDTSSAICGWSESGKQHWMRGTRTPSSGTGANQAHTGQFFMFLETSRKTGSSYLTSPALPNGTQSMAFFYHMHGAQISALEVLRD